MTAASSAAAILLSTSLAASGPTVVLRMHDPALVESSGLAVSGRHPGVVWTHPDGGTVAQVMAVDRRGNTVATLTLDGINPYDPEALAPGKATIKLDFAYDGNGRGKGATTTIYVNDRKVGAGRVENTNANIFSADDAADVGIDEGTNVSSSYAQHDNRFTGRIAKVQVDVR